YISADFQTSYVDNETLKNHGVVLLGAALTNRPVIKKMQPTTQLGEGKMDELIQKLLAMLGLKDATELEEKVTKLMEAEKKLSEVEPKIQKEEKKFEEQAKELKDVETQLSEVKAKLDLSEKNGNFNVLLSEGKVVEAQRQAFLSNDMIKFAEHAGKINT